jgi:hypothetical protein
MDDNTSDVVALAAHHALHLRQWIGAADAPVMAMDASKEKMLAALRAAEIDLLLTFRLVARDEVDSRPVCGVWTLNQLAGHLADWDELFVYWLGLLRGNAPQAIYWDEDGDALNDYMVNLRAGDLWADTWAECRARRTGFYEALAQVPPEEFLRVQPARKEVSYPTIYHCAWSALEHYLDHAAGVRRHLGLALPSALLSFHGAYT